MAVESVIKQINAANITKASTSASSLNSPKIRAYKYEKGEKENGEYVVVNHLPFTHGSGKNIEDGIVNINVHVPQLKSGGVPTRRLEDLCKQIIGLFQQDLYINGAYYDFYSDSRPTFDNDETYYVNLQIRVIYNNIITEEINQ